MTSKAALAHTLLRGEVINARNIHKLTGYSNVSREIIRCIEREDQEGFGVNVQRTPMQGVNRYGVHCKWFDYKLKRTEDNLPGIKRMRDYVNKELKNQRKKN